MSKKKSAQNKANTKPATNQATLIEETTIIPEHQKEDSEVVNASEETPASEIPAKTDENVEVESTETIQESISETEVVAEIHSVSNEDVVASGDAIASNEVVENAVEPEKTNPDTNNVIIEEVVAEAQPKKSSKKKTTGDATNVNRVKLVGTSYHYFRNWLKQLFRENGIQSAKFIKNEEGWLGHISILDTDKEPAIEVLNKYRIDNPDTKTLWWDIIAN